MRISSFWAQLVRAARWHRRSLAALAAAGCVLAIIGALSPAPEATVPVVVAARALDGSDPITDDDLTVAEMPSRLVPDESVSDPTDLVGRLLAAPVPRGAPVTSLGVISSSASHAKGELLVPIHVRDRSALQVVRSGDRVTIVAAGQDGNPVTIAARVRVAQVPATESDDGVLLVAAPEEIAQKLAAWSGSSDLGIALG